MGFRCGIVGLPNAGKSTLFNALTEAQAAVASYPFCTIEPNVGTVPVSDERLERLNQLFKPRLCIPTTLSFVDIAGLVRGASRGEGLGNQFLGHIREVDAVAHVVRCFREEEVTHVEGRLDPVGDAAIVDTELILADLELIEKRLHKFKRPGGCAKSQEEMAQLEALAQALNEGQPARNLCAAGRLPRDLPLLTAKPMVYVANVGEEDLPDGGPGAAEIRTYAEQRGCPLIILCAQLEAELMSLDKEDRATFMAEYKVARSGLEELIQVGYNLLNLVTFFTVDGPGVRAWTIKAGTPAVQAAGKIHSDFQRGFIRAEVIPYGSLIECGGLVEARDRGLVRLEGKDYQVQDGDVIHFRFNV